MVVAGRVPYDRERALLPVALRQPLEHVLLLLRWSAEGFAAGEHSYLIDRVDPRQAERHSMASIGQISGTEKRIDRSSSLPRQCSCCNDCH